MAISPPVAVRDGRKRVFLAAPLRQDWRLFQQSRRERPQTCTTRQRSGRLSLRVLVPVLLALHLLVACAPATYTAAVLRDANLRTGPGLTYPMAGMAAAGQTLRIAGRNAAGDWYQLESGEWIAASLVRIEGSAPPVIGDPIVANVPAGAVAAEVVRVVDGDTIRVRFAGAEVPVRYILINTPETDEPFGAEATAANRRLVEGKTVYLLKDVSETDRFNRLLRYVFLADGTHVNAELVRQGYAQVSTFPPDVTREAEMRAAQQEAMDAGRGLWAPSDSSSSNGLHAVGQHNGGTFVVNAHRGVGPARA